MTYFLGGGHILQNGWIIWSPLLYFNFKSFKDPNSFSNIRFQCKLYDSGVLFLESSNFQKSKRGHVISWGEPILQNDWIIWSSLLYFNFKSFKYPNFLLFIRFQCILLLFRSTFLRILKFLQIKEGTPNFLGENNFAEQLNYLASCSVFQF